MISRHAARTFLGVATTAGVVATAIAASETASPRGEALSPRPATSPKPDDFISLDLSKYPMEHHLLHSAMQGEDKLEEYKLFLSKDRRRLRANARLGAKACGHPHIVHGGAISSLFDDSFGALFLSSGHNGFTANLNVNFKKPLPAGTDVVLNVEIDKVETSKSGSLKVYLKGYLVKASDEAVTYTEASALFIGKDVPLSGDKIVKPLRESIQTAISNANGGDAPAGTSADAARLS